MQELSLAHHQTFCRTPKERFASLGEPCRHWHEPLRCSTARSGPCLEDAPDEGGGP